MFWIASTFCAKIKPNNPAGGGNILEKTFSGYCRRQDGARIVLLERDPGEQADVDCDYRVCEYAGDCPVGQQITDFLKDMNSPLLIVPAGKPV